MIVVDAFGIGAPLAAAPPTPLAARGSTIDVVRYEPRHLRAMAVEGRQAHLLPLVEDAAYAEGLAQSGPNWTALDESGAVLCVAGVYVPWEGRAIAHAILSSACGRRIIPVIGAIDGWLRAAPYDRIEAHVATNQPECHRFARFLGFVRECTMPRFLAGEDFDLYARVK